MPSHRLLNFRKRCPLAPEDALFPFEVRHLLYATHPMFIGFFFTIEDDTVLVLHIRHGRRQPLKH